VKFIRQRYQSGSLSREVRKAGPAVWIFRWRENAAEGRVNRKVVVGTIEEFPTKTAAKRAVETLRSTINPDSSAVPITVAQLVRHYEDQELPTKAVNPKNRSHILENLDPTEMGGIQTFRREDGGR
jgi:integrase